MAYTNKLTEEEEMLRKKFAKLRQKKKMIQQLRQSKSNPQTPTTPTPKATKKATETSKEDARELAKKVLAAQQAKLKSENKERGFKRSGNLERKLRDPDKGGGAPSFTPFSAGTSPRGSEDRAGMSGPDTKKFKGLYDSFISKGTLDDEKRDPNQEPPFGGKKRGNTIYVSAPNIDEALCKEAFTKFGPIANIAIETERTSRCAFITFNQMDDADKAVETMNGSMVKGRTLRVHLARKQPSLEAVQNNTNSPWTKLAGGITKQKHKDRRQMLNYTDDDMFS